MNEINKCIEYLSNNNIDLNNVYECNNILYQYIYIDYETGAYIPIHELSMEYLKMTKLVESIKYTEKKLKKLLDDNDYESYFYMVDKPFRIEMLNSFWNDIPDGDKIKVFKFVYSSSEYNFQDIDEEIYDDLKNLKDDELDKFEDEITIYRGETDKSTSYEFARSWTLNYDTAKFFATRFKCNGKIYKSKIKKSDCLLYINNEEEILVSPEKIKDIELVEQF